LLRRRSPRSTLFPYTTLFRSMGGGEIIASFLDAQAIDEFVISVAPVFIGDGIPLMARRDRHMPLDLCSSDRFEAGVVQLHYRVRDRKSTRLNSSHVSISYAVF